MRKILYSLLLIFCITQQLYPQAGGVVAFNIPSRNSLKFNRQFINPTFSFVREQNKYISINNKREWVQFDNAPETYLLNFSGRFSENIGSGLTLFQQNFGVLSTFGGVANFTYNATLGRESNLSFGTNLGFYQTGLGRVVAQSPDASLDNFPSNSIVTINPGINYGSGFFDFGVSLNNFVSYNLTNSQIIEDNPEQTIQAHGMYTGYLDSRGFFDESRFTGLISTEFKNKVTIISAMALLMVPKGIWVQGGYNSLYALTAGFGINISPQIALEYNYEKGAGRFSDFGNSHDLTLAYKFVNRKNYIYNGDDEEQALLIGSGSKRSRLARRRKSQNRINSKSPEKNLEAKALEKARIEKYKEEKAEKLALAKRKVEEQNQLKLAERARVREERAAEAERLRLARLKKQEDARSRITKRVEEEEARQAELARVAQAEAEKTRLAEAARLKAEEEARQAELARVAQEGSEKTRLAEAARLKAEGEARQAELARVAQVEAEKTRLAEAARLKAEEEARQAELARVAQGEAEKTRLAEAARLKAEEEARQAELARIAQGEAEKTRLAEAARLKAEEEARQAELARIAQAEAEKTRLAEAARLKAEEEARQAELARIAQAEAEKTRLAEAARLKAEEEARQAELARIAQAEAEKTRLAEAARLKAEEEARQAELARIAQAEAEKTRLAEAARLKAEEEARQAELARTAQAEAEKTRLAEAARLKAEEEARQAELARIAQAEAEKTRLAEAARLKAEEEARQAELARIAQAEAEKTRLAEAARLKAEEEARQAELARIAQAEAEKTRLAEAARLKAEEEAREESKFAAETKTKEEEIKEIVLDEVLLGFIKSTEDGRNKQKELIEKLNDKVAIKQQDLKDLKEENDLSEQGIVSAPKAFKSVSAENAVIEDLKLKIDNSIKTRSAEIKKIEQIYNQRLKKRDNKNDVVNKQYLSTIQNLKEEQNKALRAKENLVASLGNIKVATDIERNRRIKRAAYDSKDDRYNKDRAALKKIQQLTPRSTEPLTADDFDFGEPLSNIQIVKGVKNEKNGYYLVVAVHNDVDKRDAFLKKAVAAGEKDINFFFDLNTNKYYIYYDRFEDIGTAKLSLDANKGNKPYNGEMSLVKIEK